jgi:hypothetical protein
MVQSARPSRLSNIFCGLLRMQVGLDFSSRPWLRLCVSSLMCFCVGTVQRISLFGYDFYSGSTLILTTTAVKQCMDLGSRPHICERFLIFLMLFLTLTDCLWCAWYICICYCLLMLVSGDRVSSIYGVQLSGFHLKTERGSSLRNVVCFEQNKHDDE